MHHEEAFAVRVSMHYDLVVLAVLRLVLCMHMAAMAELGTSPVRLFVHVFFVHVLSRVPSKEGQVRYSVFS